jgi:hypothetical protein
MKTAAYFITKRYVCTVKEKHGHKRLAIASLISK